MSQLQRLAMITPSFSQQFNTVQRECPFSNTDILAGQRGGHALLPVTTLSRPTDSKDLSC